ncbi:MAG: hypothetical protein RR086_01030 [Clostridia bacterium]
MARIVVMDSGIGGMAILHKLKKVLPNCEYLYFADTANLPYGDKTTEQLNNIAFNNVKAIEFFEPDLIVIACNTLTLSSLEYLQSHFPYKFMGTRPPISAGLDYTTSSCLLVGTEYSINSCKKSFGIQNNIIYLPLPLLAPLVEEWNTAESQRYITERLQSVDSNYDSIVLGCTHYYLIENMFYRACPNIKLFDSVGGIAQKCFLAVKKIKDNSCYSLKFIFTKEESTSLQKYLKFV